MPRPLAIALLVTLPETGPVVVLVRVERSVRTRVALVGFPVIAMSDGIVTLAVASVRDAFLVAVVIALRERGLLITARGTLGEHRSLLTSAHRRAGVLAVVSSAIPVREPGPVSVARCRPPVEGPAAPCVRLTLQRAFAIAAIVGSRPGRCRPSAALHPLATALRGFREPRGCHYRRGEKPCQQLSPRSYAHHRSPRLASPESANDEPRKSAGFTADLAGDRPGCLLFGPDKDAGAVLFNMVENEGRTVSFDLIRRHLEPRSVDGRSEERRVGQGGVSTEGGE